MNLGFHGCLNKQDRIKLFNRFVDTISDLDDLVITDDTGTDSTIDGDGAIITTNNKTRTIMILINGGVSYNETYSDYKTGKPPSLCKGLGGKK